jgi:hypothetical protein
VFAVLALVGLAGVVFQLRRSRPSGWTPWMCDRRNSDPGRPKLSEREKEVLTQWFRCESKQIVAHRSGISVRTGGTLLDRVRLKYAKAGRPASTKAALLARAIQDGLVDLDEV